MIKNTGCNNKLTAGKIADTKFASGSTIANIGSAKETNTSFNFFCSLF
jgi:hypothetical protein